MSAFYQSSQFTQLGDHFKISVYSQVASGVIGVSGRLRDIDGRYSNFEHRITITATGAQTVRFPASGAWWILSCVAQVVSGTINPGDVLVKVELVQGDVSAALSHQVLLYGYPSSSTPIFLSSAPEAGAGLGVGRLKAVAVANPAAGAGTSWTVPAGTRAVLAEMSMVFTASAAVANRVPYVYIESVDLGYTYSYVGTAVTASQARYCQFTAAITTPYGVGTFLMSGLNDRIALYPGDKVYWDCDGIDVADTITDPTVNYVGTPLL